MSIRKTGSATGQVTGIDRESALRDSGDMSREAAIARPWSPEDDQALTAENEAADEGDA